MKFRAELPIKRWTENITYDQKIMLIGSCFTEHMGKYLADRKFNTLQNPHGILFNPISIANSLLSYIENVKYTKQHLFKWNDIWSSWDYHSRFSTVRIDDGLQAINASQYEAFQYLKNTSWLIITLGSAFVYELSAEAEKYNCLGNKKIGNAVANCHKAPADWFNKRLLSTDETLHTLQTLIDQLHHFNPTVQIILTISPVRHLREGLMDNNRSKAVLIQTVHTLCEKFDHIHYFPAYELVIDDLRDYRFYAEDLAHPNYQATQYVWEKFVEMCIHPESVALMHKIEKVRAAYLHKPLQPETPQHQAFLQSYLEQTQLLQQQLLAINFSDELNYFNNIS